MAFLPFIGPAVDLVNNVLKRVLPEKMSESERANLQQQITLELMKADWSATVKEFEDRADARALAKADVEKGNWFTNMLSATVRPVFGYLAMLAFFIPLISRLSGLLPDVSLNQIEKEIVVTIIYFYFGGRTVEKGIALWKGNGK